MTLTLIASNSIPEVSAPAISGRSETSRTKISKFAMKFICQAVLIANGMAMLGLCLSGKIDCSNKNARA